MDLIFNAIAVVYACLGAAAAFSYFRNKGNTIAEACAYGLMTMLMTQSWLRYCFWLEALRFSL
jgi:hypothetical protein